MSRAVLIIVFLFFMAIFSGCFKKNSNNSDNIHAMQLSNDVHSFSNPNEVVIKHMHLNLTIDFKRKVLSGNVALTIDNKTGSSELHLDSRQLKISHIVTDDLGETTYKLSKPDSILGSDLNIRISPETKNVTVYYETSPEAEALQWLTPAQTHDKLYPFLFSQSQAILARTWIPCQDSPGIKFTYSAEISCDKELMVLMSAENDTSVHENGKYRFRQSQPVSSYLLAIAAGNVAFRNIGRNSGVYAEPGMLEAVAWEFADMQGMIDSAEALYGAYRWGRYDVLVLPPSFPFGGMENPCLTFATPTVIAGDRSLVSLVAHELAHSWSGNLVTNETWDDFWLNEGFTVYFEQRIMEKIYGAAYENMQTVLGMGELTTTIEDFEKEGKPEDTHLYLNLKGRNPDDGLSDVAYEKGRFFLQAIEKEVGREAFDAFLRKYFDDNAFKPMNTEKFIQYLNAHLIKGDEQLAKKIQIDAWVYGPGLPNNSPKPYSEELEKAAKEAIKFHEGTKASMLNTNGWTTHHWLQFLRSLDEKINTQKLSDLDAQFHFTQSMNCEILCDWFKHTIPSHYSPATKSLEDFLTRVGRRKFLTPLYERLAETPSDKEWARQVFVNARPGYHAVAINTIEDILK